MRLGTPKTRRLDLRPERCPPLRMPEFLTLRCAGIQALFLGLFDVTPPAAVAACSGVPGVWCQTGPKFSKTGPKYSHIRL